MLPHLGGASLSVLHGVREADMAFALTTPARPVLNSPEQIARWKAANGGPCDVMIDTGMNRLGLDANDVKADLFEGLEIETLMSHLACADEDGHQLNMVQPMIFRQLARRISARRLSIANSAGILAGDAFAFDSHPPGHRALRRYPARRGYGPHPAESQPRVQILQRRVVRGGESVGYGATYVADRQREAAIINIGYADGYYRAFGHGRRKARRPSAADHGPRFRWTWSQSTWTVRPNSRKATGSAWTSIWRWAPPFPACRNTSF